MLSLLILWSLLCGLTFLLMSRRDQLIISEKDWLSSHARELLGKGMVYGSTPAHSGSTTEKTEVKGLYMEPAIDRSAKLNEDELANRLQAKLPNLPILYWQKHKNHQLGINKTCAKFPDIYDLHFNNIYWQETKTSNGTFLLYGAYLDVRSLNKLKPTVRILGMINRLEPKVKTFCQMWFKDSKEPIITEVLEYKYIWYKKWGNYKQGLFQPYLLACQIPKSHAKKVPASVSIVENKCDTATSNLRVIYNPPDGEKEQFAVCVKGMDFPEDDLSVKLTEWIELLAALGANKIFLYNLEVHPNVTKVLDYYSAKGVVDVTPLSLPGHQPNLPVLQHMYLKSKLNNKRQNELIPYNDCLYRNLYRYKYIVLLDIDEVIVPIKHINWSNMMEEVVNVSLKVKNATRASWNFRNVYFMDEMLEINKPDHFQDIPDYLHMMQHVYRSQNYTKPGQYVKCFHNPERALILHNHFPLACLGGVCTSYPVDMTLGHLQHYRKDCVKGLKKSCDRDFKNASVKDTSIWKWKKQVIKGTSRTLNALGFFSKHP